MLVDFLSHTHTSMLKWSQIILAYFHGTKPKTIYMWYMALGLFKRDSDIYYFSSMYI